MHLRLGNLTPEQFAERVGSEFTPEEAAYLRSVTSWGANLTGPDDFHIFEHPSISVTVGSTTTHVLDVFKAANARKPFNREVSFDLDDQWSAPTEPAEHGMLPGSHEHGGAQCRCGMPWDYWNDRCLSMPAPTEPEEKR